MSLSAAAYTKLQYFLNVVSPHLTTFEAGHPFNNGLASLAVARHARNWVAEATAMVTVDDTTPIAPPATRCWPTECSQTAEILQLPPANYGTKLLALLPFLAIFLLTISLFWTFRCRVVSYTHTKVARTKQFSRISGHLTSRDYLKVVVLFFKVFKPMCDRLDAAFKARSHQCRHLKAKLNALAAVKRDIERSNRQVVSFRHLKHDFPELIDEKDIYGSVSKINKLKNDSSILAYKTDNEGALFSDGLLIDDLQERYPSWFETSVPRGSQKANREILKRFEQHFGNDTLPARFAELTKENAILKAKALEAEQSVARAWKRFNPVNELNVRLKQKYDNLNESYEKLQAEHKQTKQEHKEIEKQHERVHDLLVDLDDAAETIPNYDRHNPAHRYKRMSDARHLLRLAEKANQDEDLLEGFRAAWDEEDEEDEESC